MERTNRRAGRERGQILVIFALGVVSIIAMTGLVIDGGSTFVQRREQQNVADAAAMAGAYAFVDSDRDQSQAVAAARSIAAANGYTDDVNGVDVAVEVRNVGGSGGTVAVTITRPHRNYFAGIVGFPSWPVGASATAEAGVPNGAWGSMPLIFNQRVWNAASLDPNNPVSFSEPAPGSEDVPQTATQFNWTVFCEANGNECNGDSSTVDDIIEADGFQTIVSLDFEIGPLNAGSHTDLYSDLASRIGESYPVAIVADDGDLVGWAMFTLTGSVGGSTKQISGYFEPTFNDAALVIGPGGAGSSLFGAYRVRLIR